MLFFTPKIEDILPLIDGVKTVRKLYTKHQNNLRIEDFIEVF